jgi:hypothetical protein
MPFKRYRFIVRAQHYQNHKPSPETCGSSAMHLQRKLLMVKDANSPVQKFSAIMFRTCSFRNLLIQEGMFRNYGEFDIIKNFKDFFFPMALWPNAGHDLVLEGSRSHTTTHQSR